MLEAVESPYLVDASFSVAEAPTRPAAPLGKKALKKTLARQVVELRELQRKLYAQDRWSLLLIFQAMDAAGKDGTIRAVLSGINPAGCQVFSFKKPSDEERDHDFLWRTAVRLPERGRIGVFNRSYYEEVLVVRVHPAILDHQKLPHRPSLPQLWQERLESIADHERHLARSGTAVVKFWLNVSPKEQQRRLLQRIEDPARNWKFASQDVAEREHWAEYMAAYQAALRATSKPWAPWYAIPADHKPSMRVAVADIIKRTLQQLDPQYPTLAQSEREQLGALGARLKAQRIPS